MAHDRTLVLDLLPSEDDTWLYVGSGGSAFLTGDGTASGVLVGSVRWSGRACRTDRWQADLEGTIRTEDEVVLAFSATGFLIEEAPDDRRFIGGIRFASGDPSLAAYNRMFRTLRGDYDLSSGRLRLEAAPEPA